MDRKESITACDLLCLRNGAQVPTLPECDSALQVQAAPKHSTPSLSAANSEQRAEFVDTSQKDLTD